MYRTRFDSGPKQVIEPDVPAGCDTAEANAISHAKHHSRSHDAVIRVYDEAGNVIDTHKHKGDFKEW